MGEISGRSFGRFQRRPTARPRSAPAGGPGWRRSGPSPGRTSAAGTAGPSPPGCLRCGPGAGGSATPERGVKKQATKQPVTAMECRLPCKPQRKPKDLGGTLFKVYAEKSSGPKHSIFSNSKVSSKFKRMFQNKSQKLLGSNAKRRESNPWLCPHLKQQTELKSVQFQHPTR